MPSITAMLEAWWQLTEAGIHRWDRESVDWAETLLEIPKELRDTGLC